MAPVDMTESFEAPCAPDVLFAVVDDLAAYSSWLSIVPTAEPAEPVEGDGGPVWTVELRGRIGPLARSKRLRMVRTLHQPPARARFERRELDGRDHSPWILDAVVSKTKGGSKLQMHLHYGGSFGGAVLERLLRDEIEQSRRRLLEAVLAPENPTG
jgi:hypothetical protein